MSTTQLIRVPDLLDSLTDHKPTRVEAAMILDFYLPRVATDTAEGEGWDQGRRVLSAAVHFDLNPRTFDEAVDYADQLTQIRNGADLKLMYGEGTHECTRPYWEDYMNDMLSSSIDTLVSGIER